MNSVFHYAHYDDDGKIIGLYNSEDHSPEKIPTQIINLSFPQYLQVVARPNDFRVEFKKLIDSGASADTLETSFIQHVPKTPKWQSGFMYKGTCYLADAESSAHITQCLVISCLLNLKYVSKLKTANKLGEIEWKEVTNEDLKAIAEGVNKLRTE